MRVAFASADFGIGRDGRPIPGGSGWARVHQLADRLTDAGHRAAVGPNMGVRPDGRLVPMDAHGTPVIVDPELVVIQRWMNRDAARLTRAARATGQTVIHDVDDWFWGLDPANRAHRATSRSYNPEANRHYYRDAVSAADAVTVSTAFLAKRIRQRFGVDTILLRNAVDMRAFPPNLIRDRTRGIIVGWCGALAWRSGDLETLAGVLDPYLEAVDGTFVHHGTFPADTDTAAGRAGVHPSRTGPTMSAVPPWDYPDLVTGMDIGIVPLAPIAFNQAKSWIKGLEYAAAGIPFIAARTPEYEALGAGLLASRPSEWRSALDRLTDPAERALVRDAGLRRARELDVNRRWRDWEDAYAGLLGRRAQDQPRRLPDSAAVGRYPSHHEARTPGPQTG